MTYHLIYPFTQAMCKTYEYQRVSWSLPEKVVRAAGIEPALP
jgi:hypothetical protein